jgi:hypothetical protein
VRIKKEDFNKLNQLDRIEYRQRIKGIYDNYSSSLGIYQYLILLTFFTVVDMWGYLKIGRWIISYRLYNLLIVSILLCVLIDFIVMIAFYIIRKNKISELDKEYFLIKAKKGRK